jgi:transposase
MVIIGKLIINDFDKGSNNMKGLEPAVNKRFRRLFKNTGYETYLINEFRTSKLCNCCNNELETFMEKPSKKPKTKGQLCLSFGILRCKSVMPQCNVIHNRDKNAVQNMLNIVQSIFNTGKRPIKFTRETSFPLHDGI